MIVLDASFLIAHMETDDAHHEQATQTLLDLAPEQFAASPLTLAEVLTGPLRQGTVNQALGMLNGMNVLTVPLGADGPLRLASLRATTKLKLPGCCVLLAAERMEAEAIATFDARLAAAAQVRGLTVIA